MFASVYLTVCANVLVLLVCGRLSEESFLWISELPFPLQKDSALVRPGLAVPIQVAGGCICCCPGHSGGEEQDDFGCFSVWFQ